MTGKITLVTSMFNKNAEVIDILNNVFFPGLLLNRSKKVRLIIIDDCSPLKKETEYVVNKYIDRLRREFCSVIFIRNEKNLGFAKSYNKGIKMAKTKYILVANDDVYFPVGSIRRLVSSLDEKDDYGLVGPVSNNSTLWTFQYCKQAPRLKSYLPEEFGRIEKFSRYLSKTMEGQRRTVDSHLCGFCFAAKTEFLKEFGGFNESYNFGQYEDTDLVRRVVSKYGSRKIAIIMDVFVGHGGRNGNSRTLLQEPHKMVYYGIVNGFKYLNRWGFKEYLKVLTFGLRSQMTGKGTISDLIPNNIKF